MLLCLGKLCPRVDFALLYCLLHYLPVPPFLLFILLIRLNHLTLPFLIPVIPPIPFNQLLKIPQLPILIL